MMATAPFRPLMPLEWMTYDLDRTNFEGKYLGRHARNVALMSELKCAGRLSQV